VHLAAEAARRLLRGGAFVWLPEFLPDLAPFPRNSTIDLEALLTRRGDDYARELAARYSLTPGGRAGRFLHRHGVRRPWRHFDDPSLCRRRLCDTSHFHVDLGGAYVPGLCAGIVLPLAEVPGEIDLARYPLLRWLAEGGPAALVDFARDFAFEPNETYSSACDLCTHVRDHLHGEGFLELGPDGFYQEASLGSYD